MKKNWTIPLCAALLCALCACGGQTARVELPPAQDAGEPAVQNAPAPAEPELPQEDEAPTGTAGEDQPESAPAQADPSVQNTPKAAAPAPAEAVTSPVQTKTPQEQPAPKPEPESAPESKPSPEPGPAPQPESKPDPAPEPEPKPEPAPEPEPAPAADRKAVAQGLVGHPVSELYAAIGRPLSADYAPSCLVLDGEDGELVYDGFTVYTEKGPDYETVYAVF